MQPEHLPVVSMSSIPKTHATVQYRNPPNKRVVRGERREEQGGGRDERERKRETKSSLPRWMKPQWPMGPRSFQALLLLLLHTRRVISLAFLSCFIAFFLCCAFVTVST